MMVRVVLWDSCTAPHFASFPRRPVLPVCPPEDEAGDDLRSLTEFVLLKDFEIPDFPGPFP